MVGNAALIMTLNEAFTLAVKARERERAENIRKAIQDIEIQPDIVKAMADEFAETLRLALSTVKIHEALRMQTNNEMVPIGPSASKTWTEIETVKVIANDISIDGGSYWHVTRPSGGGISVRKTEAVGNTQTPLPNATIYNCATCARETASPRIDLSYRTCYRCEDVLCDGPITQLLC